MSKPALSGVIQLQAGSNADDLKLNNAPASTSSAVSQAYVTSVVQGAVIPVQTATSQALPTYTVNNSNQTLTGQSNGALVLNGVPVSVGDRVLVKDETGGNQPNNGYYAVTATGGVSSTYVLTRTSDALTQGKTVVVGGSAGAPNASTLWLQTSATATGGQVGSAAVTFGAANLIGANVSAAVLAVVTESKTSTEYSSANNGQTIATSASHIRFRDNSTPFGMVLSAGASDAQTKWLWNVGTQRVTLTLSGCSAIGSNGASITTIGLGRGASTTLAYDQLTSTWMGQNAGADFA